VVSHFEASELGADPEDLLVPVPIVFNCWKHHLGVIRQRIDAIVQGGPSALSGLVPRLLVIGTSQMDVYCGQLAPETIAAALVAQLKDADVLDPKHYQQWLSENGGYRCLELPDTSRWVLRWGLIRERYVHIHPARYSPETFRVRAPVLKTAIAACVWARLVGGQPTDVTIINQARQQILGLAPVKSLDPSLGISPVVTMLLTDEALNHQLPPSS